MKIIAEICSHFFKEINALTSEANNIFLTNIDALFFAELNKRSEAVEIEFLAHISLLNGNRAVNNNILCTEESGSVKMLLIQSDKIVISTLIFGKDTVAFKCR